MDVIKGQGQAAIAGMTWCHKVFKNTWCQAGCVIAVEFIKENMCYYCCKDGNFWKTCIEPFSDIPKYMGGECNPYID